MWRRPLLAGASLPRLAIGPGGAVVTVGETLSGSASNWLVQGWDAAGRSLWSHQLGGNKGRARGAAWTAAGTLIAVGYNDLGSGGYQGVVAQLSPFGHAGCDKAGACWGKTAEDCDDGNPCTVDNCDAKSGCTHDAKSADGAMCPVDGKGCALAATCKAGKCEPQADGKLFMRGVPRSKHGGRWLAALAQAGDAYVGFTTERNDRAMHRVSYDASGNFVSASPVAAPTTSYKGVKHRSWEVVDAVAVGDRAIVLEHVNSQGTNNGGHHNITWQVSIVDASGKRIAERADPSYNCRASNIVTIKPGEEYVAVGNCLGLALASVFPKTGKIGPIVKAAWPVGMRCFKCAAARLSDGSMATMSTDHSYRHADLENHWKKGIWMRYVRWDKAFAKVVVDVSYKKPVPHSALVDMHELSGDDAGAVTIYEVQPGHRRTAFMRIKADGTMSQLRARLFDGQSSASAIVSSGDDAVVAWWRTPTAGAAQETVLTAIDARGGTRWQRVMASAGTNTTATGLRRATGDVGFVLLGGVDGVSDLVVRTDPWGNHSCLLAGTCFTKKLADCDDKNPCTTDLCDPAKGCTKTSLKDGVACATGKTCKAGVCQ